MRIIGLSLVGVAIGATASVAASAIEYGPIILSPPPPPPKTTVKASAAKPTHTRPLASSSQSGSVQTTRQTGTMSPGEKFKNQ